MNNIVIPDFLLSDIEPTKFNKLIEEYDNRFDKNTRMIEGYDISKNELEKMLEQCLKENCTLFEILDYDPRDLDKDEEI